MQVTADDRPFGPEIAQAAVRVLREKGWIVRMHRDYTGHGLFHDSDSGAFFLAPSDDGYHRDPPIFWFSTEAGFVDWLSRQSDLSLSGHLPTGPADLRLYLGNQRVTRKLLLAAIAGRHGREE